MGEAAGIDIGPGDAGDGGVAQEGAAVVDADGFAGDQGSGERAADG